MPFSWAETDKAHGSMPLTDKSVCSVQFKKESCSYSPKKVPSIHCHVNRFQEKKAVLFSLTLHIKNSYLSSLAFHLCLSVSHTNTHTWDCWYHLTKHTCRLDSVPVPASTQLLPQKWRENCGWSYDKKHGSEWRESKVEKYRTSWQGKGSERKKRERGMKSGARRDGGRRTRWETCWRTAENTYWGSCFLRKLKNTAVQKDRRDLQQKYVPHHICLFFSTVYTVTVYRMSTGFLMCLTQSDSSLLIFINHYVLSPRLCLIWQLYLVLAQCPSRQTDLAAAFSSSPFSSTPFLLGSLWGLI